MLLGAGDNTLRLFQKNNIFSRERPLWQDKSRGDDSWQYGQVSVSGVAQHQVKRDLSFSFPKYSSNFGWEA